MNAHVCQTLESIAEMKELMRVDKQLGCKFIGIVQDTLIGSYLMSRQDTFLSEEFATYVYMHASEKYPELVFPRPSILKPKRLWTGRKLLSLIFHDTPLTTPNVISPGAIHDSLTFYRGELVSGQITKSAFGEGGMFISNLYINYGSTKTAKVINYFQAIVNPWVFRHGVSVGIKDCIPSDSVVEKIKNTRADFYNMLQKTTKTEQVEELCESLRSKIAQIVIADSNGNRIREMAKSGSKGSDINLVQIQGCLGQQNIGGHRPFREDYLRVFPQDPYEYSIKNVESRGLVSGSLIEGLSPREYFSHAAGGREGIIDTGIKTSKTGYSTRRMACVTEGAVVTFTGSVFNQSILQGVLTSLLYGADGVDASKLVKCSIQLHTETDEHIREKYLKIVEKESYRRKMFELLKQDQKLLIDICIYRQRVDDIFLLPVDTSGIFSSIDFCGSEKIQDSDLYRALFNIPDTKYPVFRNTRTRVGKEINSTSTRLFKCMLRCTILKILCSGTRTFTKEMFDLAMTKIDDAFQRSLVEPGEPVGLIATQTLMQSTMQATLNTFHSAGTGAGAAATGGLNYFDALISVQVPKITTTTIILEDPRKEFLVMEAIAPPVRVCDVVSRCVVENGANVTMTFELDSKKMYKKCCRPMQVYQAISKRVGTFAVELISVSQIRVSCSRDKYSRTIVEDIYDIFVKTPHVSPRGKDKSNRGVVGARRVKKTRWIHNGVTFVNQEFTQIEVYGNFRLADIYCIDGVDASRTYCNDVLEIQNTLGTQAAKQFMFFELFRTVAGSESSSKVNPRFVMQVIDYMSWTGAIEPVTRHGMKLFGPMKSAAFEQPGKVLVQAALAGKNEHMLSPTSNVVFGQEIRGIGTAIVDAIPIDIPVSETKPESVKNDDFDDLMYQMPFNFFTENVNSKDCLPFEMFENNGMDSKEIRFDFFD